MKPAATLTVYGVVLVAVVGLGAAIGEAVGPIDVVGSTSHSGGHSAESTDEPHAELPAGGLLIAEDGYRFVPDDTIADAGEFTFTIVGPDGQPVTEYDELHERTLHLIVASRDLAQYAHLHPTLGVDGRWTVELPAFEPGTFRAFADFQPTGADQYTLGVDLNLPGKVAPEEPLPEQLADTVAGLDVRLDWSGTEAAVSVRRDGEPVATEPYLGAAGHLVVLRSGDLAYLHVHPLNDATTDVVRFAVDVPSAGTYAMFFDFQVDGVVHTAHFAVDVRNPAEPEHGVSGHTDAED
jgi:hypothetical protein